MAPAKTRRMDAVMFHLKSAHLTVQRVGRTLLRPFGMTPARFDLMNALGTRGMKQSELWRRLHVVRSAVSELLAALEALAWVKRVRAADGRTRLVQLTRRGREILERAYAACVESGVATVHMDAGLCGGHAELDAQAYREELGDRCEAIDALYRTATHRRATDLYPWRPDDYWFLLTYADDRS